MMANDRDPQLQALFADATADLDGEAFISRVMAQTRSRRNRLVAGGLIAVLVMAAFAWLFTNPVLGFVQLITQILTTSLIDLGEGWLAWVLAPVNTIASLLVLSVKGLRVFRKKVIGTTY